ncbi:hypothetical protein [Mesorhizobium sp. M8A.F.Ca.ET.165.01.1.1]|uniref:hypothetical protein n=1 Tax=Mesorhizobium sp. M8A.F.Ca.ET.165.01.1.1 TaxID=2563960 RepID=UPI001093DBD7|nr:hypothetical protein [Mesorhizobium sp. M8A.F.Ca.ET.165.01.1.1]TGT44416.1 hypothetical protein EN808_08660 [Mesorhizobium sp. M8A.F.Ca.ET.165.01.1.1]
MRSVLRHLSSQYNTYYSTKEPKITITPDKTFNWFKYYAGILVLSLSLFVGPKFALERFSVSGGNFTIVSQKDALFAANWNYFLLTVVLFQIAGWYSVAYGGFIRRIFLTKTQLVLTYVADLAATGLAIILLIMDKSIWAGILAGNDIIGIGTLQRALAGRTVIDGMGAAQVVSLIHMGIYVTAATFASTLITNFVVCADWRSAKNAPQNKARIEYMKQCFFRNMYASTILLTVGVFQLAAWVGLPATQIPEPKDFSEYVTSIIIYMSVSFSLIAFSAFTLSVLLFNMNVRHSELSDGDKNELAITVFDTKLVLSAAFPALMAFVTKTVPSLIGS